jgi:histidine triad (HIT) family protein|tara:strand:- start:1010 stop:1393 length:384 start_codon:yes stop_codon:yes gene_type:complete
MCPINNNEADSSETVFGEIVRGTISADVVYQDKLVTAFRDIQPRAPVHILIVPNKTIRTMDDVKQEDEAILGRMLRIAADIARNEGLGEKGYRLIINCKEHGGQEVYYLHMHIVGGTRLGRMVAQSA